MILSMNTESKFRVIIWQVKNIIIVGRFKRVMHNSVESPDTVQESFEKIFKYFIEFLHNGSFPGHQRIFGRDRIKTE
jgi:hypothetical protein